MKKKTEKIRRSYLIWAPPYDNASAGIIVLHRLAVELLKRGESVFINTELQNPKWEKDRVRIWATGFNRPGQNDIAIYPEIVPENPFNAKTVVRYLLNLPGKCSLDYSSMWGRDDIYYTYSKVFNTKLHLPEDRILFIPTFDEEIFYDMRIPRSGRLVYHGKDNRLADERLKNFPILGGKESFRGEDGQTRLAEALNRCELLYCYDNCTSITVIAQLCGCPVVLIPDGSYTKEEMQQSELWCAGGVGWGIEESAIARSTISSLGMSMCLGNAELKMQWQLDDFIEKTQNS